MAVSKSVRERTLSTILSNLGTCKSNQKLEACLLTIHLPLDQAIHGMTDNDALAYLKPIVKKMLTELKAGLALRSVMGSKTIATTRTHLTLSKTARGLIDATGVGLERNAEGTRIHLHLSGFQLKSERVWAGSTEGRRSKNWHVTEPSWTKTGQLLANAKACSAQRLLETLLTKHLNPESVSRTLLPALDWDGQAVTKVHRIVPAHAGANPMTIVTATGYSLKGDVLVSSPCPKTKFLVDKGLRAMALLEYSTVILEARDLVQAYNDRTEGAHTYIDEDGIGNPLLVHSSIMYSNSKKKGLILALEEIERGACQASALTGQRSIHFTCWSDPALLILDTNGLFQSMVDNSYCPTFQKRGQTFTKIPSLLFVTLFNFRHAKCMSRLRMDLERWDEQYFGGQCMAHWQSEVEHGSRMENEILDAKNREERYYGR